MRIGLIAEGASELRILKHIIGRYLGSDHEVNEIQPRTNPDGSQEGEGGWTRVIQTFEHEGTVRDALIENDYVLIQIDTDQAQIAPFSVNILNEYGQCCSSDILYGRVRERIMDHIPNLTDEERSRVLLVICIHEIECWLLPLYYDDNKRCKTTQCVKYLNDALIKNKIHPLSDGNKNSPEARRTYNTILKKLRKPADIEDYAQYNFGFSQFVNQLRRLLD